MCVYVCMYILLERSENGGGGEVAAAAAVVELKWELNEREGLDVHAVVNSTRSDEKERRKERKQR